MVKNKALTFAPAFKNESNKFFEILINNTSSTSKKIEPSILVFRAAMFEETIGI